MNILRTHSTLQTMLQREIPWIINPRQNSEAILKANKEAEALVLYKSKQDWIVVPVGAGYPMRNVGVAARSRVNNKPAVAVCYLKPREEQRAAPLST